ncbi:MAG: hypothetical protein IPP14_15285 [Planctomycetes bacterium]|nr:hypothetical protein [Planctomycetota bacterium]
MKALRIVTGLALLAALAASVIAGVYVLRASDGSGLQVVVAFAQPAGLAPDDGVLFGDKVVGRVEAVRDNEVTARVAAEFAEFVHDGSRFWRQKNLGGSFLCFDTPPNSGPAAQSGRRFAGTADRPELPESMLPPPLPRKLSATPAWLCDVRVVITVREGQDTVRDLARHCAAAVVGKEGPTLLVLAPSWLLQRDGETVSERARVELSGGENCTATLLEVDGPLCVLSVQGSVWQGPMAKLWPMALADGQGLVLVDFAGTSWAAAQAKGTLEFRARLEAGNVALVDGLNLAGFALPTVGERYGARWVPLNGAGSLIDRASLKLR